MDIDKAQINKLETDIAIINKYVKSSSFGNNKFMYFPLLIGIALSFFLIYSVYDGLTQTIGIFTVWILFAITILCFILVIVINHIEYKKMKKEIQIAPICIAKKIYGNDKQNIYYCIYTTEQKRHDETFINNIAEKILAISPHTKDITERQVNKLFQVDLVKPGEFAKKLPLSFTDGVNVWRRQFTLNNLSKNSENNKFFWVVAINPENAKLFIEMNQ